MSPETSPQSKEGRAVIIKCPAREWDQIECQEERSVAEREQSEKGSTRQKEEQ